MKHAILVAALLAGSASAVSAGGFNSPAGTAAGLSGAVSWTGFHGGLQFGHAEADVGLPTGFAASSVDIEGRHYGLHVGYLRDFGSFVGGAELSYDKLDDFEVAGVGIDDLEGHLVRAKLLAGYDAGRVMPYAAVSLARVTLEIDGEDGSETGIGFGIGAKFMVTPRFMAGIEWMRNGFETSFDGEDLDIDVDTVTISASYRF